MADFNGFELATNGKRLATGRAVVRRGKEWRSQDCGLVAVCLLAAGSLLMSAVSMWGQRKIELENSALRMEVEFLQEQVDAIGETLKEINILGPDDYNDSKTKSRGSMHSRLKRSNAENRRRRHLPKVVQFRLDASPDATVYDLKWKIWNGSETNVDSQMSLQSSIRLSDDKKRVTIDESGLYFIYAQVHFENAKQRNVFAIKVDNTNVMKCFQSLDYFNPSLNSTLNSRIKPCYTASTIVLRQHQTVSIQSLYSGHRIYNDPYANFWGLVKLADLGM